jgi:hypothetical protein
MVISGKFVVKSKYKGKSKYDFWKNLQIGDILEISLDLSPSERNGRGSLYATYLKVQSGTSGFSDSISGVCKYIEKIDLDPVL